MVDWYAIWRFVTVHRLFVIIEKRAGAAKLLREYADRFDRCKDAKTDKRNLARKLLTELSPEVRHLCGFEMHKRWKNSAETVGDIDAIDENLIDDWIRCHRDWLIRTAREYEQQADDMRRTGAQH